MYEELLPAKFELTIRNFVVGDVGKRFPNSHLENYTIYIWKYNHEVQLYSDTKPFFIWLC